MKEDFTVQQNRAECRIDLLLAEKFTQYSRTQWQKIIAGSSVLVNSNQINSPSYTVKEGDVINIDFTEPKRITVKLDVIYEDKNIVVIDKPANLLSTDETFLSKEPTVEDTLQKQNDSIELIHRLDKETSGVLIAAKNTKTKKCMQDQFRNRTVKKHYIALVDGTPDHNEAVLNWPIARHTNHPVKWTVERNGRKCITRFSIKKIFKDTTLVDVYPQTGRTHQIRVHLAHLGNPIICDSLYGNSCTDLDRHFLHAESITIQLPDGADETFESKLPQELTNYLNALE